MTTLDARALVEPEGHRDSIFGEYRWFSVEPSVLYPAALDDLVARGQLGETERTLALVPRIRLTDPDAIARRAAALELARMHFHAALIESEGPGVGLHIRCDLAWRL